MRISSSFDLLHKSCTQIFHINFHKIDIRFLTRKSGIFFKNHFSTLGKFFISTKKMIENKIEYKIYNQP